MTILNTSLVLEALNPAPSQVVLDWLNPQTPEAIYLTAVSLAELLTGVEALPSGRRRLALEQAATPLSPRLHASSAWDMHVHHGPDRQDLGKVLMHDEHVVNQPNARVVQRLQGSLATSCKSVLRSQGGCCREIDGSEKKNVAPCPTAASAHIWPA